MVAYDPFEGVQRDWENAFSHLLGRGDGSAPLAPLAVDVREDGDHLYVEADVPGCSKDDIEITLENSTLTITAQKQSKAKNAEEKNGEYLLQERRYARLQRSFTLPPTVDGRSVDAKLSDGVLSVTLTKREETKPRKIAVT